MNGLSRRDNGMEATVEADEKPQVVREFDYLKIEVATLEEQLILLSDRLKPVLSNYLSEVATNDLSEKDIPPKMCDLAEAMANVRAHVRRLQQATQKMLNDIQL